MPESYGTKNTEKNGGDLWEVGGILDIITGGVFKVAGTDATTRLAALTALTTTELGTIDLGDTVGTASAGVTAVETGTKTRHTTVLTVADFEQAITGADLGFGKSIYTFPEGFTKIRYATIDLTMTSATETGTPDVGVGSVIATGAVTALNGTATFEDVMDGFTGTAIAAGGAVSNNYVEAEAGLFDGHTTATEAFLNLALGWTATETMTISATITLIWDTLGDY